MAATQVETDILERINREATWWKTLIQIILPRYKLQYLIEEVNDMDELTAILKECGIFSRIKMETDERCGYSLSTDV